MLSNFWMFAANFCMKLSDFSYSDMPLGSTCFQVPIRRCMAYCIVQKTWFSIDFGPWLALLWFVLRAIFSDTLRLCYSGARWGKCATNSWEMALQGREYVLGLESKELKHLEKEVDTRAPKVVMVSFLQQLLWLISCFDKKSKKLPIMQINIR